MSIQSKRSMKPLYIWAGGKNKMIPKYLENPGIPSDKTTFIEPFFGGGAVYFDADGRFYVSSNQSGTIYVIQK